MKVLQKYNTMTHNDIIIAYQMGKVGSSSVQKSLKAVNIKCKHMHSLYRPVILDLAKKSTVKNFLFPLNKRIAFRFRKRAIRFFLKQRNHTKIISLVREPVSYNMSMFFQLLHLFIINKNNNRSIEETNLDHLIKLFFGLFNHSFGINWFDNELKKVFGVDVYNHDFDTEKGYTIIKKDNIEVLVMQMEKLNEMENVIADFSGAQNFVLSRENNSAEKWYSCVYKKFKENIVFPKSYIDSLFESKYMKHFYTEDNIKAFRKHYKVNDDK